MTRWQWHSAWTASNSPLPSSWIPLTIIRDGYESFFPLTSSIATASVLQTDITDLQDTVNTQEHQLDVSREDLWSLQYGWRGMQEEKEDLLGQYAIIQSLDEKLVIAINVGETLRRTTESITISGWDDANKADALTTALQAYEDQVWSFSRTRDVWSPPDVSDIEHSFTLTTNEAQRLRSEWDSLQPSIDSLHSLIIHNENNAAQTQNQINQLENDQSYWWDQYTYWASEFDRLDTIVRNAASSMSFYTTQYASNRTSLQNIGRVDVPANIGASDILTQINNLKDTIMREYATIPATPNTGALGTDMNLPDETSSVRNYLNTSSGYYCQYYYIVDFPSSGTSWPATVRVYMKLAWETWYTEIFTYGVRNRTVAVDTMNQTAFPKIRKLAEAAFVNSVLRSDAGWYQAALGTYNANLSLRDAAATNRDNALAQYNATTGNLSSQQSSLSSQQSNLINLQNQKTALETQKAEKQKLETKYEAVKNYLNQLREDVNIYNENVALIEQIDGILIRLQQEITWYTVSIALKEQEIATLEQQIRDGRTTIATKQDTLLQTEGEIVTSLRAGQDVIPQDTFTRTENGRLIPSTLAADYFTYAYRTSQYTTTLNGQDFRWLIRAADTGNVADIYPSSLVVEYHTRERAYHTPAIEIRNFAHKEFMNDMIREAMKKLAIALNRFDEIQTAPSASIEHLWWWIWDGISELPSANGLNPTITAFQDEANKYTTRALLSAGVHITLDHFYGQDTAITQYIDNLANGLANRAGLVAGSDSRTDLVHLVKTTLAQEYTTYLGTIDTTSLTTAWAWQSHLTTWLQNHGSATSLASYWDINTSWNTDTYGNKYRFILYYPDGLGSYSTPAKLAMLYSPDGINTQVIWPRDVASWAIADAEKERLRQELLATKQSHTNYQWWSYDIFRGWDEDGKAVWWGRSSKNGINKTITFSWNENIVRWSAQAFLESQNISSNFSSNEVFYRSLFQLPYDQFSVAAKLELIRQFRLSSDLELSQRIGEITLSSMDVSSWTWEQREIAEIIISLSWIHGFPAEEVRLFQNNALQQMAALGASYEQSIINDTIDFTSQWLRMRQGNLEELRTIIVLQKLSQIFIKKKTEMNVVNNISKLSEVTQRASNLYQVVLGDHYSGMTRAYFAIEEGVWESNLKRNRSLIELCSGDGTLAPGGWFYFLWTTISLADMWNILLWHNANQLWLSLEETVFGSFVAQTGIETLKSSRALYENWSGGNATGLITLIGNMQFITEDATSKAYNNEVDDQPKYAIWFSISDTSPSWILQAIIQN